MLAIDAEIGEDMRQRGHVEAAAKLAVGVVVILAAVTGIAPDRRAAARLDQVGRHVRDDVEGRHEGRDERPGLAVLGREDIVVVALVDLGAREEEEFAEAQPQRIELGAGAVGHRLADDGGLARLGRRLRRRGQRRHRHHRLDHLRLSGTGDGATGQRAQRDQQFTPHGPFPSQAHRLTKRYILSD